MAATALTSQTPRIRHAQRALTRMPYGDVVASLMQTFGISEPSAHRDIRAAYRLLAQESEEERPHLRARELERLNRLAAQAEQMGDITAAIRASAQIAKLCGLEAPTTVNVGLTLEQQALLSAVQMTPHERRRREAELRALDVGEVAAVAGDASDALLGSEGDEWADSDGDDDGG